ncbi:protein-L-isoaspartate(D-aspartate) O-methyltransferase [Methylovirgula sp. 4M-Z18]|uniref:protein-L-isoaspartate(D-aspartate) O-methyltransferase n=1 Tax=Methylovirgula sp. 4M-Z18 TaxID=2293567 RepID=UPI000E2F850A|nr:protein-L-isoaspartate(D-aspartate) O-methyltransferase [Methylovirgula sp. 4M-Z18]RFB81030.1 protein-L-isoaspartate(D-aspartate) O-methyltransferase [Methylovirgula sp. 4M-Z18]
MIQAQATAEFLMHLRSHGVRDLTVLRAMETVPRQLFAPHRYADLAWRDVALPIACGQTMSEPLLVARMMEALQVEPHHRVLEIGAGTGYATAILARLAAEVVSLERFQSLAVEATARLEKLGLRNAGVAWADGCALPRAIGNFDRIVIHAAMVDVPKHFSSLLMLGGAIVLPLDDPASATGSAKGVQYLVRLARQDEAWSQTRICRSRFAPIMAGVSRTL